MPTVDYGNKTIEYSIEEKEGLKSHYITVERNQGVVLKGKPITSQQSQQLILKRAKWILEKLKLVEAIDDGDIVTGSRIQYLGRRYYVQVIVDSNLKKVKVEFNESKFKIYTPTNTNQHQIQDGLNRFLKDKANEKITPRLIKWSKVTGLEFNQLKIMKLDKRWGSCTPSNNIHINIDAVRLPYSLIDYLLVHELVHTKIKNHSKEFWSEVSKHIPNWKALDEQMGDMKF